MVGIAAERRARRAEQRRRQILAAASRVFARKGYDRATTREIADEADLAEGTIYNYFDSKQQLLLALAQGIRIEFEHVISRLRAEGDPSTEIARGVRDSLRIMADNAEVIRGLVTGLWNPQLEFSGYLIPGSQQLVAKVERLLATGVEQGRLRPHDTDLVAKMVVGMVVFLALPFLRRQAPLPSAHEMKAQGKLVAGVLLTGLLARG